MNAVTNSRVPEMLLLLLLPTGVNPTAVNKYIISYPVYHCESMNQLIQTTRYTNSYTTSIFIVLVGGICYF